MKYRTESVEPMWKTNTEPNAQIYDVQEHSEWFSFQSKRTLKCVKKNDNFFFPERKYQLNIYRPRHAVDVSYLYMLFFF